MEKMNALVFDTSKQQWEKSRGFLKVEVPIPRLEKSDADSVIVKVRYAGVCGSDRGIWSRQAFREQILGSLKNKKKNYRVIGHEFCGEIAELGPEAAKRYKLKRGDFVSAESHVVCNRCFQCRHGQKNVCTNEKILGISHDGCFAEYLKVPGHIIWKTDVKKIRPEVAAIQEPFGNAVHAVSKTDVRGKTVAIFGLGPIGLFALLIAKGLGAKKVIGIAPKNNSQLIAKKLGIDELITVSKEKNLSFEHDPEIVAKIKEATDEVGADVSLEMAGYNSSVNTAIHATRRGGDVILFGIKSGNFVLENYNALIVKGQTIHLVIGRELWKTWETTKSLLENKKNKIQDQIYNVILEKGKGTILSIDDYSMEAFEQKLATKTKFLLSF